MRLLFAVVVYQMLPLGPPFSNFVQRMAPGIVDTAVEHREAIRPLPPLTHLLPNAGRSFSYDSQPLPNGLAHHIDLTRFSDPSFVRGLAWVCIPCLLLYVAGIGLPVALPLLALATIGARTLHNSQGAIHHGFQIVSLILVAQSLVALYWLFRRPREALVGPVWKRPARQAGEPRLPRHGRDLASHLAYFSLLTIAGCYVIAGSIKLVNSDWRWPLNAHFIGIQVVKTDRQNWHNHLDSESYGKEEVPWASDILDYPNTSRCLLTLGLLLELFAFACLLGRLPALLTGVALIVFHYFNERIMGLVFYNNEKVIWIFLVLPGLLGLWAWWRARRRRAWETTPSG